MAVEAVVARTTAPALSRGPTTTIISLGSSRRMRFRRADDFDPAVSLDAPEPSGLPLDEPPLHGRQSAAENRGRRMARELLSEAEIAQACSAYAQDRGAGPKNTFDLGLVLGGTVSAGAYTAGVVDFLLEALDEWSAAKRERPRDVPSHRVRLKVVAGTSGGGVIGATLAKALPYAFPHVSASTTASVAARNPLYDVWVNRLSLEGFAATGDLDGAEALGSLLCPQPLIDVMGQLVRYEHEAIADRSDYVGDSLELILTLSNLRGMPYAVAFSGRATREYFIDHADYIRFACSPRKGERAPAPRPDAFDAIYLVDQPREPDEMGWPELGAFARGTSGFPVGFPGVKLKRPLRHYAYRPVVVPSDNGTAQVRLRAPVFELLADQAGNLPELYDFVAVDGGATNNQPIELARTALAGLLGRNPRHAKKAFRGIMLVDPFAERPNFADDSFSTRLFATGPGTIASLVKQARYASADLLLALDPECFSRFLITAVRQVKADMPAVIGSPAIATAGMSAFLGFFAESFRRHDFLLGRRNCQDYLREEFTLDRENPVFVEAEAAAPGAIWGPIPDDGTLPVVPLVGTAAVEQKLDPWPKGRIDLKGAEMLIRRRARRVVDRGTDELKSLGTIARFFVENALDERVGDAVADYMIEWLRRELAAADLI